MAITMTIASKVVFGLIGSQGTLLPFTQFLGRGGAV